MSTVLVRIPHSEGGAHDDDEPLPASRFAEPSSNPDDPDLATVVRRIRSAKRIVVVCGAGVSTAASIPDFRSSSGLFARGCVKDLFHIKSLTSPHLLPSHHALLSDLNRLADQAEPTAFHLFLRDMDREGRLLRVYTQNIDGLEARAGLKTGIPVPKRRGSSRSSSQPQPSSSSTHPQPSQSSTPSLSQPQLLSTPNPTSQAPSPASGATTPNTRESSPVRCIPLHGLLSSMHCTLCSESVSSASRFPLPDEPLSCPKCDEVASIRSALSERQRKVGTLRPSVVLYGEEHPQGEAIGTVMERDLRGTGPRGEREGRADLLLVAGTSLSIPGVKRMVKEMAKSLSRSAQPVKAVYVNAEPPSKPTEWDGVFDVWAQGDVQDLAALVEDTSFAPPLPKTPRRKKDNGLPTPSTGSRKRKAEDDDTPTKRTMLLTPASTPQKSRSSSLPSPSPLASPSPPPRPVFVAEEPKPTCVAKVQAAKGSRKVTQKKDTRKRRKHSPSPSLSPEPEVTPTKPVARFSPPPPLSFDMTCLVEPNNVRCLDDRR